GSTGDRGKRRRCSGALEALEKREGERNGDEGKPAQRLAVPLLEPRELGAVGTFAHVLLQAALLLASEPSVRGARDRQLCLGARQLVRELVGERASSAKEECLEGAGGDTENVCDLLVGASFELAEDDRLALLRGNLRERSQELADRRSLAFVAARRHLAI